MQETQPIAILKSPSGQFLIDMGQNMVGWLRIKVVGGSAGHKIQLQFVEALENRECATRTLRAAKAQDTVILAGDGTLEWEPNFTYHGFRYVGVDNWPGALTTDCVTEILVHSDMTRTGSFSCSSPLLNRLHENIIWSMRGNFLGIPTDGSIHPGEMTSFNHYALGTVGSWMHSVILVQLACPHPISSGVRSKSMA